ncbi:MAG: branched-chain amino acid ABC transporter permease, partial [Acidimicrobiia bacterium]
MSTARVRTPLMSAGAVAAILILTQLVMRREGGTPPAILVLGVVVGLLNGLVATGLILIYRNARIINFAHSAMGALGGSFTFYLVTLNNWPFLIAFVLGIAVSALVGLFVEVGVIRRFFHAPRLAVTVLTIALAAVIVGFNDTFVARLPIFPEDVSILDLSKPIRLPFPNFKFRLFDLPLDFGFGHVFSFVMSVAALLGLGFFLRYTRAGVAVRASAENAERAELLGISVRALSTLVWTIAGTLAGLGVILTASVTQFSSVAGLAPAALVPALAAGVIGRMRSLPVAIGTSVGLSVIQQAVRWS